MKVEIVPIAISHADSFHAGLDAVARERKYLAIVEAPPLERLREFIADNVARDVPQFVAVDDERVIGWCDIVPASPQAIQHRGTLGMGILASYRGKCASTASTTRPS